MKWIRRGHLYTGLVLLPWVIFFGFSGMLFNHPEWFGPVEVVSTRDFDQITGMGSKVPRADVVADDVISGFNRTGSELTLRRVGAARIDGSLNFETTTSEGRAMVLFRLNAGEAEIRHFPSEESVEMPDFTKGTTRVDSFDEDSFSLLASHLVADEGFAANSELKASERGSANVRFVVEDERSGERWNVAYDLVTGKSAAKPARDGAGLDPYSLLSRLHKTHHYPDRKGIRWFWTLFADATGITMVFWGLSGLVMWWQLKQTRLLGIAGLAFAGVVAAFVFVGTLSEATWVPRASRGGGSGGKGVPEQKVEKPEAGEKPQSIKAQESSSLPSPQS